MEGATALALALVAALGCPHAQSQDRRPARPQSELRRPAASMAKAHVPTNDRDVDGLSRNPDRCDTGCIGGNPD